MAVAAWTPGGLMRPEVGLAVPGRPMRSFGRRRTGTPYGVRDRDEEDRRSGAGVANLSCAMIPMLD